MLGKKIVDVPDEVVVVVVVGVVAVVLAGPATVRAQVVVLSVPLKVTVVVCAIPLTLATNKPSAAMPLLKFKYFMLFPLKSCVMQMDCICCSTCIARWAAEGDFKKQKSLWALCAVPPFRVYNPFVKAKCGENVGWRGRAKPGVGRPSCIAHWVAAQPKLSGHRYAPSMQPL